MSPWASGAPVVIAACGLVAGVARPGGAQAIAGAVADRAGRALSGVVVTVLDSTGRVVARTLSNERGEYRVLAPTAGQFALRALRIGHVPLNVTVPRLAVGETVTQPLIMDGTRVTLETIQVTERDVCRGRSEPRFTDAWEQVRAALASAAIAGAGRGIESTTLLIERTESAINRRIESQSVRTRDDVNISQPWRAPPIAELRRLGYARVGFDGSTTYYGPTLDVLSSPEFLEDYCIRLVAARDTSEIGVAFEPVQARRAIAQLRGTLWLRKSNVQLERLEFVYVGGDIENNASGTAGGSMRFARRADSAMVIARWELRMPQLVRAVSPNGQSQLSIQHYRTEGAHLIVQRRGDDTLFRAPRGSVRGVAEDSATRRALVDAIVELEGTPYATRTSGDGRFVLRDVLPGSYAVRVRTPSWDSLYAPARWSVSVIDSVAALRLRVESERQWLARVCRGPLGDPLPREEGAVAGLVHVRRPNGDAVDGARGLAGVRVRATWNEVRKVSDVVSSVEQSREAVTDSLGVYRVCRLPVEAGITLTAIPPRGAPVTATFQLSPAERFAVRRLAVDTIARVIASGVETLPARDAVASTDAATAEPRAPDTSDPRLRDFADHRRRGIGVTMTREELARYESRPLAAALNARASIGLTRVAGNVVYLSSRRTVMQTSQPRGNCPRPMYTPTDSERDRGIACACYSKVYLDGVAMNAGDPTPPFDVNTVEPRMVEALEFYATASEVPARYLPLSSPCGMLMLHGRRQTP
jgi:hypothetical protein